MTRPWVLLTEGLSGQSRCTVAAARALDAAGYDVAVTVSGGISMAAASRACARRVPVPPADEDPNAYAAAVREEMARHDYDAVVPTSDAALIALDAPVRHLLDKAACTRRAAAAGIPVAPARVFPDTASMRAAADELDYPLVVKPAIKRSLATRVDDAETLQAIPDGVGEMIVQPFIDAPMTAVAGVVWKGRLVAAVHMEYERIWPLPCGTVASARTTLPDVAIETGLLRVLEGYDGPFHAEFLGPYLQDLNPRLHGTLPLAVASGVNLAAIYCDLVRNVDVPSKRGVSDVFFRWIEGDVRSISRSLRMGEMPPKQAMRALAPRRNAVHSYESFRDPGPMFTRLRYARSRVMRGLTRPPKRVPAAAADEVRSVHARTRAFEDARAPHEQTRNAEWDRARTMTITRPMDERDEAQKPLRGGGVVLIAGPDGTGKSTLSRGLADSILTPVRIIHHRPGILPRRGTGEVADPHGQRTYGRLLSWLKIAYVWSDYVIGWWLRVRPLAKRGWVIVERGWPDLVVDPFRYRIKGGKRLTRFLGRLTPAPDLAVVLEAPVATLLERKTELSADELARQQQEWRIVSTQAGSTVYIDTTRDSIDVLRDAVGAVADTSQRLADTRVVPGWTSLPSRKSARWILPRGPRKVAAESLRIYQPVTIRGIIGWTLARGFARVGGFRLLPRTDGPPADVMRVLARVDRSRELSIALCKTRTIGGWIALLVDSDGRSRLIGPIATSGEARQRLEMKRAATSLVHDMPAPLSAPLVAVHDPSVLLFEPVEWRVRLRPWRIPQSVAASMGAYHAVSSSNGHHLPAHKDFAPWNLLRSRDGWVLLDWEDPDWRAEGPFQDLFHYLVQAHALLGRPSRRALLAGLRGRGWIGAAIEAYRGEARCSSDDVMSSFLTYLKNSLLRVDLSVPEGAKQVRVRAELLSRLEADPDVRGRP
jgi:hypothetical protein